MDNSQLHPSCFFILTFHCADNLGAMLQAYGLLTWLSKEGFDAFIVNYVPAFLRGREWLFPYVPYKSLWKRIDVLLWGLKRNLKAGRDWRERKRLMTGFRTAYLTGGSRAIRRVRPLSRLEADLLIAGSDQIWNSRQKRTEAEETLRYRLYEVLIDEIMEICGLTNDRAATDRAKLWKALRQRHLARRYGHIGRLFRYEFAAVWFRLKGLLRRNRS